MSGLAVQQQRFRRLFLLLFHLYHQLFPHYFFLALKASFSLLHLIILIFSQPALLLRSPSRALLNFNKRLGLTLVRVILSSLLIYKAITRLGVYILKKISAIFISRILTISVLKYIYTSFYYFIY